MISIAVAILIRRRGLGDLPTYPVLDVLIYIHIMHISPLFLNDLPPPTRRKHVSLNPAGPICPPFLFLEFTLLTPAAIFFCNGLSAHYPIRVVRKGYHVKMWVNSRI